MRDTPLLVQNPVTVLVNDSAGSAERAEDLRRIFGSKGVEPVISMLSPPQMIKALQDIRRREPEAVFVGGGDGTIRLAASLLYNSNVALGVLPLGTLNHFSKDLGVPADMEEAVPALLSGTIEHVDVGSVNGAIFVNNASLGIYPEAVLKRTRFQESLGISKYMAMTIALLHTFKDLKHYGLTLMENGTARRILTPFLFIGNNLYSPDIFAAAKRESLKDGVFSLFYAHRTTRVELLELALRTLLGYLEEAPKMEMGIIEDITIDSRRRKIETALDGEVFKIQPPLKFRLLPGALKVLMPRKAS